MDITAQRNEKFPSNSRSQIAISLEKNHTNQQVEASKCTLFVGIEIVKFLSFEHSSRVSRFSDQPSICFL